MYLKPTQSHDAELNHVAIPEMGVTKNIFFIFRKWATLSLVTPYIIVMRTIILQQFRWQ